MQDFGLIVLNSAQTTNIQFNAYNSYNDAAAYINNLKTQLQNGIYVPSMGISPAPISVELTAPINKREASVNRFPRPCTTAGTYWGSIPGSGGMFSRFSVYFGVGSSGITSASFYTTGTNIGWSWSQTGSFYSGWHGCAPGLITWGGTDWKCGNWYG